jgi:hypothetical protein
MREHATLLYYRTLTGFVLTVSTVRILGQE